MPISRAVLVACITALGVLLMVAAGLLVVLVVVQALRGDVEAQPLRLLGAALAAGAGGVACRLLAARLHGPAA